MVLLGSNMGIGLDTGLSDDEGLGGLRAIGVGSGIEKFGYLLSMSYLNNLSLEVKECHIFR